MFDISLVSEVPLQSYNEQVFPEDQCLVPLHSATLMTNQFIVLSRFCCCEFSGSEAVLSFPLFAVRAFQ
jgi:hypothetical protein